MTPVERFIAGVCLSFLSCILSAGGLTLQKLSTLREEEKCHPDGEARSLQQPHSRLWLLGVVVYVAAAIPDVFSYVLAPQVVCSAIGCFRLVLVTVLAGTVLGEKVTTQQISGMAACSIGTFMCLYFGPVETGKAAMMNGFAHPAVKVYLTVGGCVLLVLFVLEHREVGAKYRHVTLPLLIGLAYALEKVFNTVIGFLPVPHVAELFLHKNSAWILMAAAIAFLGLTDFYLNLRATRLMAVQVFVPVSFVWGISLQYFQSMVIFAEFDGHDTAHAVLSIAGACTALLGAICIQLPHGESQELPENSDDVPSSPSQNGVEMEEVNEKARSFLDA